ncbi:MAG: 4-hydroxy-tetrahydrodipicolinate reductase [Spirochaetales bacterium]|nr:4-hydroxy-tetrahydrodipicolinate reductase [Spirochaetales bacterium]
MDLGDEEMLMVRIVIHGCSGKMGRVVAAAAAASPDIEIAAGIDVAAPETPPDFPVYSDLLACDVQADVVIDFSSPKALGGLLEAAAARGLAVVVATTGLAPEDQERLAEAAQRIAVFRSANMSLGINLLSELAQKAASVFGDRFDIEIVERHHNQKKDAPSGTALLLADAINEVFLGNKRYLYGRHGRNEQREVPDIGIHAVRAGTIVGEHEVIFAGKDEIVELRHSASSRQIFALGALQAARFLKGKPPGLYSMKEMITAESAVTRLYTTTEEALVSLYGVPWDPVRIAEVFRRIGEAGVWVDMISQTAPVEGSVSLSFTLYRTELQRVGSLLESLRADMPALRAQVREDIAKIAVEGPGMETQSGVAARVFGVLAAEEIQILSVSTSETKITLITQEKDEGKAVQSIKAAFSI